MAGKDDEKCCCCVISHLWSVETVPLKLMVCEDPPYIGVQWGKVLLCCWSLGEEDLHIGDHWKKGPYTMVARGNKAPYIGGECKDVPFIAIQWEEETHYTGQWKE